MVLTLPIPAHEIESGRKLGTVQDFLTEESEFEVNITQSSEVSAKYSTQAKSPGEIYREFCMVALWLFHLGIFSSLLMTVMLLIKVIL